MSKDKNEVEADFNPNDDLRSEYDPSSLKGGVRGKHFVRYQKGTNLARLAPDVRSAFPTDAAVNDALRSLMPKLTQS